MPMTYAEKCEAVSIVARHCPMGKQTKMVVDLIQDAFDDIDALEGEVRDLRKKAGCEMCVADDGHALYGAVGKYYYGDDVTDDCFCVKERQERERKNEEQDIFPLTREWVIRIGECIGELKETGFVRATFTDYMNDKNNEARHKIMFHRIFTHLNEFNKEGLVIGKEGKPYAMAWRKGEELVIGTMV